METLPDYLKPYVMSYPATRFGDGNVCSGHVKVCEIRGHATMTDNGVVSPFCPRCGEHK